MLFLLFPDPVPEPVPEPVFFIFALRTTWCRDFAGILHCKTLELLQIYTWNR